MKLRHTCLLLFASTFCLPSLAAGDEWVRFRGPNGTGQSDASGIPTTWTNNDYKWRVKLPGISNASPVISGEQVFVTSANQEDGTRHIHCLKTVDGSVIWQQSYGATTFDLVNSKAYDTATPTVDADHVYMAWGTPDEYAVVALGRKEGNEVWRRDLGPFNGDHGFGASPILCGDMLILPNEQTGPSSIVALDRVTGKTQWQVDRRMVKTAYSTPFIYRAGDGPAQLIFASSAHGVSSLDPQTGKSNWELGDVFGEIRVVGSPVVAAGLIFAQCGGGGGGKRMIAVKPGNPADGTEARLAYDIKDSLPYVPTPVAKGDLLFFVSDGGVASCIDAPTGERLWRERIGGNYFGSLIRIGDRIYVISRSGEMVVLAAADEFEVLGRIDLEEPSHSTPAVADGVMYLRTLSHLMAIGGR
jgi:outer membrane protein assembly factor BamB